MFQDSP
jgi:hypothetical protein